MNSQVKPSRLLEGREEVDGAGGWTAAGALGPVQGQHQTAPEAMEQTANASLTGADMNLTSGASGVPLGCSGLGLG